MAVYDRDGSNGHIHRHTLLEGTLKYHTANEDTLAHRHFFRLSPNSRLDRVNHFAADVIVMTTKAKEYRRLPGRGRSLIGYGTLWLGKDHLLSLSNHIFSEDYKRFYFRDVQALIVRKTVRGRVWNILLGSLAALFTLIAIQGDIGWTFSGICAVIFFFSFLINVLRGPTCVSHLRTAVHMEKLPSLHRLRTASNAINILKPLIEEAQGKLTHPELEAKLAELSHASAYTVEYGNAAAKVTQHTRHYNGRFHEILFYLLLVMAFLGCADLLYNDIAITLARMVLFIGLIVFVILALIKQNDTDTRQEVRGLTWGTLGYLWIDIYVSMMYSVMISGQNPKAPINTWEMIKAVSAISYLDSPFLMGISILSIVCSLSLGICGIVFLGKFRREWVVPRRRPVIPPGKKVSHS